jgi:pimeloyl-ACP methyl ester carboxylesterase
MSLGLLLISTLALSCLSTSIFKQQDGALAQQYIQTIKYRNLVIDLGNGVKTNAQLTLPAIGKGPFPGVLLLPGSGAVDMNETLAKNAKPFWQIAQYLSERGFAVLRYDKRGVGANYTILDTSVWGNTTANVLIQDSKKALNVLIQQPEVDPKRISIIGHSEGTLYAPRVAIDNSTNVKNIILMGVLAQNPVKVVEYYQDVSLPLEYAAQVLDRNHTGSISIRQIANDPFLRKLLMPPSVMLTFLRTNNTEAITTTLAKGFNTSGYISIEKQLKPLLTKRYENITAFNLLKCNTIVICPILMRSLSSLIPNLIIIGNVSKTTGILLLNGENDSQTPVQQAFLLQQRLTGLNHPDHTLITYPNLGHVFYPSSPWETGIGPIEQYVLADLYAWLEAHSGLSLSYFTPTPASTLGSNTGSSHTNKTSP